MGATRPDQARSVSVLPYGCGSGDDCAPEGDSLDDRRRKRRRRRRKKIVVTVENDPVDNDRVTNTVFPLPRSLPADDLSSGALGVVFKVPADQLDLLYTVRKGTTGRTTSQVKAGREHSETDAVAFDTLYDKDYDDNTSEH